HGAATVRNQEHERVAAQIRNAESADCGQGGEDQAFGEELPQDSAAPRSEGEPNRHLLPPREVPHQQEIADVRAGDQQHKEHYSERDFQRRQQSSGVVERSLPQGEQFDAAATVRGWIIILQPSGHGRNFLLRLGESHTGLESHKTFNPARAAIFQLVSGCNKFLLHRSGDPEVKGITHEGAVKAFRRDADDGVRHAVEALGLADDFRIASETVLPQAITDYDYGMGVAAAALLGPKGAAENRRHSNGVKIVRRYYTASCDLGSVPDAECGPADLFRNP